MRSDAPRPLHRVLRIARGTLGMTQLELGAALSVSHRTVLRWEGRRSEPAPFQVSALAELVRPENGPLADELLDLAGIARPVPPPEPPPPPRVPRPAIQPKHAIDLLVYAAADAIDMPPRAMRVAMAAAFARAAEMGLTVEAVVEGLAPAASGSV